MSLEDVKEAANFVASTKIPVVKTNSLLASRTLKGTEIYSVLSSFLGART